MTLQTGTKQFKFNKMNFTSYIFQLWCFIVTMPSWLIYTCIESVFTWRHGSHNGVPEEWNGGYVGVPRNSFPMETFSFVPITKHRCWPHKWKFSIQMYHWLLLAWFGWNSNPWPCTTDWHPAIKLKRKLLWNSTSYFKATSRLA